MPHFVDVLRRSGVRAAPFCAPREAELRGDRQDAPTSSLLVGCSTLLPRHGACMMFLGLLEQSIRCLGDVVVRFACGEEWLSAVPLTESHDNSSMGFPWHRARKVADLYGTGRDRFAFFKATRAGKQM